METDSNLEKKWVNFFMLNFCVVRKWPKITIIAMFFPLVIWCFLYENKEVDSENTQLKFQLSFEKKIWEPIMI